MSELRNPPGTFDVLPEDSAPWEGMLVAFARTVERAGYGLILTPTFEDVAVFHRMGDTTDVVRKEMYEFEDKGGRRVALRPESTASVARAFVQHRPALPWKAWYAGSNFRFERPQAGRYREFHQLGIEAFGSSDPDLDVEVIALGWDYFQIIGVGGVELQLNSLGDAKCRPAYRRLLLGYLQDHRAQLCKDHQERLEENPLRVLDCKKDACQEVVAGAPVQLDHLCDECFDHFARVRRGLDRLQIAYHISPLLVRGLDYYTRTAFEFTGTSLDSAQNALGGGGRYDGLVAALGGPDTPAVGLALGMERILLALRAEAAELAGARRTVDVFVVDFAGGHAAVELTARLRRAGISADRAYGGRSPKAQFKAADRSGAKLALVVGPDEATSGRVGIKDLRRDTDQLTVEESAVLEEVLRALDC